MNSKFNQITDKLNLIKSELATAVSNKGVPTSPDASFETIETHINLIEKNGAGGEIKLEGEEIIFDTSEPIKKGNIVGIYGEVEEELIHQKYYPSIMATLPIYFSCPFTHEGRNMFFTGGQKVYRFNEDMTVEQYTFICNDFSFTTSIYINQFQFDPTSNYTRGVAQVKGTVVANLFMAFNVAIDHELKTFTLTRIPIAYTSFVPNINSTGICFDSKGSLYLSTWVKASSSSVTEFKYSDSDEGYVEISGPSLISSVGNLTELYMLNDDCIYIKTNSDVIRNILKRNINGTWGNTNLSSTQSIAENYAYPMGDKYEAVINGRACILVKSFNCILDVSDMHKDIYYHYGPPTNSNSTLPTCIDDRFILTSLTATGDYTPSKFHVIDTLRKKYFKSTNLSALYTSFHQFNAACDFFGYKLMYRTPISGSATYDLCKLSVKLTAGIPTESNEERKLFLGYALEDAVGGKVKVVIKHDNN